MDIAAKQPSGDRFQSPSLPPATPYAVVGVFAAIGLYLFSRDRYFPEESNTLVLSTISGLLGACARTALDVSRPSGGRIPMIPWTQGILRLVSGAITGLAAWIVFRSLGFSAGGVTGVFALGVAAGSFAPDLLFRVQTTTDVLLSPAPAKTSGASGDEQDGARGAAASEAQRLRKRLDRSPNDIDVARQLVAALRVAGQPDEAVRVFEQLIDADPQNDALILEKAEFYRAIGDTQRYADTVIEAEKARAKNQFDANVGTVITVAEVECKDLPFFGNFTWPLQPGVNVLLGRNGYGKSHLLRAVVAMLLNDVNVTAQFFPERQASGARATLRVDINKAGGRESTVRTRQIFEKKFGGVPVLAIPDMRYIERSEDSLAPLATVPDLRRQGAEQFIQEKPFQGIILTFLYELSNQFAKSRNFQSSIFGLIQQVVQQLTDNSFTFQDARQLDNAHATLLVLTEGNTTPLPIQKASQGTLSVLSMVGLTYRFLKALYPNVRDDEIRMQQGIVFIDEIDAHLHPVWQQRILQLFRDTFPNVQFIVTAHTPLVVAGCKQREVAVLRKESDGFAVKVLEQHFIGASALTLYRDIFNVEDKDIAYMRLNTRQAEKPRLESRREELTSKKPRTPAEQAELDTLDLELYYLDEAEKISNSRGKAANLNRERDRLAMDVQSLKGEVAELKAERQTQQRTTDPR